VDQGDAQLMAVVAAEQQSNTTVGVMAAQVERSHRRAAQSESMEACQQEELHAME
jgi:hypothetical protein